MTMDDGKLDTLAVGPPARCGRPRALKPHDARRERGRRKEDDGRRTRSGGGDAIRGSGGDGGPLPNDGEGLGVTRVSAGVRMTGDHPGQIRALPRPAHLPWVPLRE